MSGGHREEAAPTEEIALIAIYAVAAEPQGGS